MNKTLIDSPEGMILIDADTDTPPEKGIRFTGEEITVDYVPYESVEWLASYPEAFLLLFVHQEKVLTDGFLMRDDGEQEEPTLYGLGEKGELLKQRMAFRRSGQVFDLRAVDENAPFRLIRWVDCVSLEAEIAA